MTTNPDRHAYPDFLPEYYDESPLYKRRRDAEFYLEAAQRLGGPVLELGCGTGRVLLPIARTGIDVTGIDLSPQMLARCHKKLAMEPADVRCRVELIQA